MPNENPTALVKADQSPALARVSNQLALTDKLLTKPEEPFLIPYRKGDKWGLYDRNKNILIDCVYDYPRFSDENIRVSWYVHSRDDDWTWGNWETKGLITDDLFTDRVSYTNSESAIYIVLKVNPIKHTLLLVAATDAIVRNTIVNGKKTIIIGSVARANLYWMKKPSTIISNIGDKIEAKVGAEFFHEIDRD